MREPILIACAVYLGGLAACWGGLWLVVYLEKRRQKEAWGEMSQREEP